MAQISSVEFAASNAANAARDNRVARSIAAASNVESFDYPRADPPQAKEMSGDPYAGDIFSDDRIRFRPRENIGGGIEAQDAANFALAEAGKIAQDAADTREAFSVPFEEPCFSS